MTKNVMMIHRKSNHAEMVKKCTKDQCNFQDKFCWFIHETNSMNLENNLNDTKHVEEDEDIDDSLVFRDVRKNLKPPLETRK